MKYGGGFGDRQDLSSYLWSHVSLRSLRKFESLMSEFDVEQMRLRAVRDDWRGSNSVFKWLMEQASPFFLGLGNNSGLFSAAGDARKLWLAYIVRNSN